MGITRRQLSVGCGMGALAWTVGRLGPGRDPGRAGRRPRRWTGISCASWRRSRWNARKAAGASYADIRINRYQQQTVALRSQPDFASGKLNHVPSVSDSESFGFGLRVLAKGTWGFSAAPAGDQGGDRPGGPGGGGDRPGQRPAAPAAGAAGAGEGAPGRLPHRHRPGSVHGAGRREAGAAARGERRDEEGEGRVLGHRGDRPAGRAPVLRLDRGQRARAARLPDRARR